MIESISFRSKEGDYGVINFYFNKDSVGIDYNGNDPMINLDADDLEHIISMLKNHRKRILENNKKR